MGRLRSLKVILRAESIDKESQSARVRMVWVGPLKKTGLQSIPLEISRDT